MRRREGRGKKASEGHNQPDQDDFEPIVSMVEGAKMRKLRMGIAGNRRLRMNRKFRDN